MRIPIITAIILVAISIIVDIYILKDIRQYCRQSRKKIATIIYSCSSVILWIFIIVALCLPRQTEDKSILPIMWMLFSYLSIYIPKILYCICSLIGRIFQARGRKRISVGSITGITLALITFVLMWVGALDTREQIRINTVNLTYKKLPKSFNGLKIVHFSDMHLGTWGNDTAFVSKLVNEINAQKPDLILFTGDFVNRRTDEMLPFVSILKRLKSKYGTFSVLGNHDYGSYVKWNTEADYNANLALMDSLNSAMDWKLLKNKSLYINNGTDSIVIIGVENWGEPPFNQVGDLIGSYPSDDKKGKGLNDNAFKILLTHNPEHWRQIVTQQSNIDLSLSGHTHAMQTMLKIGNWQWSPAAWRYKDWGGLYKHTSKDGNPMNMYVNIGVGEVGFPARIGAAKPEITVINLSSSDAE